MKTAKESIMNWSSRILIPLLAVIFVISISFHNHAIGISPGSAIKISDSGPGTLHSVGNCSACLLQGNIKLQDTGTEFDTPVPLIITSLEEADVQIPSSFLQLNGPSRSPPVA